MLGLAIGHMENYRSMREKECCASLKRLDLSIRNCRIRPMNNFLSIKVTRQGLADAAVIPHLILSIPALFSDNPSWGTY